MTTQRRFLILLATATLACQSLAAGLVPGGVFVQAGAGENGLRAASAGLVWPWSWQRPIGGGRVAGYTEAYVSRWNARDRAGRANFDHVGVVPLLRYRGDGGRAHWFVEGGIGITYMDRVFRTSAKQFSTHANFVDVVGVGRSFGAADRHELTLRLTHFSNAGMRHPNPGENILRLRYAYLF